MRVSEIKGNIWDHISEGDAFAHGVNCMGVMGAGIAKDVRKRFPRNYNVYRLECQHKNMNLGEVLPFIENDVVIYNLGTQYLPGKNADIDAIRHSVSKMMHHANKYGISTIKTVRLGCGIGGLQWNEVKSLLESIESSVELEVFYLV